MSSRIRSLMLAPVLGLCLAVLTAGADPKPGDRELLILATTSTRGEVDHCGCHKAQKGGLTRRVAYVDSMRSTQGPFLLVDAGDYCHPTLTEGVEENRYILASMGKMGYDVMTLGDLELSRGADYVAGILTDTKVPVALGNVIFAKDGKRVGEPIVVRKVGDVTYGIIGLVGKDFGEGASKFEDLGFKIEDPFEVATKLVPEAKKLADFVVVLAHLGSADAFQLPKAVPGIDVVVFGHYPGTVAPTMVEGAVTIRAGQRGQYVGETRIVVNPEKRIVSCSGSAVAMDTKTLREDPATLAELRDLMKTLGKTLRDDAPAQTAAATKPSVEEAEIGAPQ
jgi:2',3'-cyclic-nucleotide 2'-phosphodiesterase (5'-nucleotidase family)